MGRYRPTGEEFVVLKGSRQRCIAELRLRQGHSAFGISGPKGHPDYVFYILRPDGRPFGLPKGKVA